MRKTFACMALCASMVIFVAEAYAVTDPGCGGENPFGIFDFSADTPDIRREGGVSQVLSAARACGTEIRSATYPFDFDAAGAGSQFVRFEMRMPFQFYVAPTNGMPDGTYVGYANLNVLTWQIIMWPLPGRAEAIFRENVRAVLRVDNTSDPGREPLSCPRTPNVIACFKAYAPSLGVGWWWVTQEGLPFRYTLTIGEMQPWPVFVYPPAGITQIKEFMWCPWKGSLPPDERCDGATNLVANGAASIPECENGNGIFTLTGTQRNGRTTEPAITCVEWEKEEEEPPPEEAPSP